ncbi:MAG TPA: DUF3108 domain-containing protein [Gammaproteobacteria bacterium]|nr:DUF3108 domain-containing protein [Gammaproteobacteria bacterium]
MSSRNGRILCASIACVGATIAHGTEPAVPVYNAVYQVEYKGKTMGSSEFKVTQDEAQGSYEFTTTTTAKGILAKFAAPNPTIERSRFTVVAGKIRPVEYSYKDGSRKGDNDRQIQFDWDRHIAIVTDKDGRREVALEDVSLDPGSLHVALMQDLILNGKPGQYRIADGDQAKAYNFVDNGEAQTDTGLGKLATHSYVQRREGSSRTTYLWVVPQLDYLPARIETRKNDEVQTSLILMSVEGLEKH